MLQNSAQRKRLITGVMIIGLGIIALTSNILADDTAAWISIIGLAIATVIFLWVYTFDRETWALIGAYSTGAAALVGVLTTGFGLVDKWVPTVVMTAIALPFFITWFTHRKRWVFLIVAYVFIAIIPITLMSSDTADEATDEGTLVAAYVMFAIGVPFIVTYLTRGNRMFLIPGGILSLIGLAFLGINSGLPDELVAIAVPIVVIAVGVFILYRSLSSKTSEQKQT